MLFSLFAGFALATGSGLIPPPSCANVPSAPTTKATANDNRARAGTLEGGVLTVRLVAQRVAWRPDGDSGCALGVNAFAEEGKPATVPGPLIRATVGTQVHITVRNALSTALWVRGLHDRAIGQKLDSAEVRPGTTREFRFVAATTGGWYYWAGSAPDTVPTSDVDGQLVGAMVIDSATTSASADDRIFVLTRWNVSGLFDNKGFQLNAMNGRSWPNTERLTYTVNDSVHWYLINASNTTHEMHLHGFFFRIDDRGFAIDSVLPPLPVAARMRVTTVTRPGEWTKIAWTPDRSGNWLFHCHLLTHMSGAQRLDRMDETVTAAQQRDRKTDTDGDHASHDMGGLVMALDIRPAPGRAASATPPAASRTLDLYANMRARRFGEKPGYGFVLQEGAAPPAADSIRMPGSTLVLTKGEPARITVHNRLTIPISVHWHGLELDSYFDGVGGFSGEGRRVAPMVAPGDSFVVRITPPRAGTFMYHVHGERGDELASGLYGHLVVADRATPFDPQRERLVSIADGGPGDGTPIFINGSASPDTLELVRGASYRFRLIYITANDVVMTGFHSEQGLAPVRFAGVDGFDNPDLPPPRPMLIPTGPGHTRDLLVALDSPGDYSIRVRRTTGGPVTTLPIRVR